MQGTSGSTAQASFERAVGAMRADGRRAVRTANSAQVRQPLYTTGMQRWRDYETQLAPLIDVLAPLLRRLPREQQPRSLWSETAA
jgi:hypothetical protein